MSEDIEKSGLSIEVLQYIDRLGNFLAHFYKLRNFRYIEGEICILLGFEGENGKKDVVIISGSNFNQDFKERIYREFAKINETDKRSNT